MTLTPNPLGSSPTTSPAASRRRAGLGVRVVALLIGLLAPLLAAEYLVRWVDPQPLQHIRLDDALYFVNRPGARFTYARAGEYAIPVTYNGWGFRGPIPSPVPPPGTTRIVLIGDSQTEGLQVRLDDTYGEVLRRELERRVPGRRFEVVNLAVSAYGTHQELLTLRRYGARVRPDWVVLGFYPDNDLSDNVRLPLVAEGETGIRLVSHQFSATHRFALGTKIWLASGSHLYVFVTQRLKALLSTAWLAKVGLIEPLPPAQPSSLPSAGPGRAHRITDRLIRMTEDEARRLGARFVVLTIPSKPQVLEPISSSGIDDMDRLEDDFASGFERDGILHVEALGPLRQAQRQGPATYFRIDGHLNARGHHVVGAALAEWLTPRLAPR